MAGKKNPTVKIGDKVRIVASRNSSSAYAGTVATVTALRVSNYIYVQTETGVVIPLYYSGPADDFELVDRESMKKYLADDVKKLHKEIAAKENQLEMLNRFETEEEEVAFKLSEIFSASNKKNPVKAIADVLRTLKKTDYL